MATSPRLAPINLRFLAQRRNLILNPFELFGYPLSDRIQREYSGVISPPPSGYLGWPKDVDSVLKAVWSGPSGDELSDLGFIDNFHGIAEQKKIYGRQVDDPVVLMGKTPKYPFIGDPFFFPPALTPVGNGLPISSMPLSWTYQIVPHGGYTSGLDMSPELAPRVMAWNLDYDEPWLTNRIRIQNALAAERLLSTYPWPSPPNYVSMFWGKYGFPEFRNFVLGAIFPLADDDIKTSITMNLLKNFDAITLEVNSYLQEKEKRDQRANIVKTIAKVAFGAIMLAFAPTVISDVLGAGIKTLDAKSRADAAVGLSMLSKQFAEGDAAFSAELDRVAREMDAQMAAAGQSATPTPDEAHAIAESTDAYVVLVRGKEVGKAKNSDEASDLALRSSSVGDTIEIIYKGQTLGRYYRTASGVSKTPPPESALAPGTSPSAAGPQGAPKTAPTVSSLIDMGGYVPYIAAGVSLLAVVMLTRRGRKSARASRRKRS